MPRLAGVSLAGGSGGGLSGVVFRTNSNIQDLALPGFKPGKNYILDGLIHVPVSAGALYTFRPNGLTTNQSTRSSADVDPLTNSADMRLHPAAYNLPTGPIQLRFRAWLQTKRVVGGVATWRTMDWTSVVYYNTGPAFQTPNRGTSVWQETATDLTSGNLFCSVPGGILAGSQVIRYELGTEFEA